MKKLALLSLLFLSTSLFSQDNEQNIYVIRQQGNYLTYGDLNFTKDFRGLRQFMDVLEEENPVLFRTMAPGFEDMRNRRSTATGLATGGIVLGTGILMYPVMKNYDVGEFEVSPFLGTVAAGTALIIAGAALYWAIYNPRRELLGFVNHFNRQTEGVKLRLTGSLAPAGGRWHGGVGVQLQF